MADILLSVTLNHIQNALGIQRESANPRLGIRLYVERVRQEQSMAAQEAYWKVEKKEFEPATRIISLDQLLVSDQQLYSDDKSGCMARSKDRSTFEADFLRFKDEALQAEGKMIRYERVYPNNGRRDDPLGKRKGG